MYDQDVPQARLAGDTTRLYVVEYFSQCASYPPKQKPDEGPKETVGDGPTPYFAHSKRRPTVEWTGAERVKGKQVLALVRAEYDRILVATLRRVHQLVSHSYHLFRGRGCNTACQYPKAEGYRPIVLSHFFKEAPLKVRQGNARRFLARFG